MHAPGGRAGAEPAEVGNEEDYPANLNDDVRTGHIMPPHGI